MALPVTEQQHHGAVGLDALCTVEIARRLQSCQSDAVSAVTAAIPQIIEAAHLMASTVREGGALVYAAAGSSGLMAMADALELPGTFGLSPDRIRILVAGGMPQGPELPGHVEDDTEAADKAAGIIRSGDTVIAVSASGSTPFAVTVASAARRKGARVICIANNEGADIFAQAHVAICLKTPAELVAGSTRMGAGTAQKVALNMMSTLMAVDLGHTHDGMMVNLKADNTKLRARAVDVVARIAGVPEDRALDSLTRTDGAVKPAVLLAAGAASVADANTLLTKTKGHLRAALARL